MFEAKEWDVNKDPVILITKPKVKTVPSTDYIVEDQYDYSESHVIYKGKDLGSFEELKVMKEENEKLKQQYCERVDCAGRLGESKKVEELKASVKYYVDILTDLKKWLEDAYDYSDCTKIISVLNKIKELEDNHE